MPLLVIRIKNWTTTAREYTPVFYQLRTPNHHRSNTKATKANSRSLFDGKKKTNIIADTFYGRRRFGSYSQAASARRPDIRPRTRCPAVYTGGKGGNFNYSRELYGRIKSRPFDHSIWEERFAWAVVSSSLIDTNKGRQTGGRHQHSGITIRYLVGWWP